MEGKEIVKMAEDIAKYVNREWIANPKRPEDMDINSIMSAMGIATGMLGYSVGKVMVDRGAKAYDVEGI